MTRDERIVICEVGMRDGLQIEPVTMPTEQKVEILNDMIAAGITEFEVTSFVSPKAIPQLADAEELIAALKNRPATRLIGLVPNLRGAQRAIQTDIDTGILMCSASETHSQKNLNRSIQEQLQSFPAVVACLKDGGKDVMGAVSMVFGCPFEGEVPMKSIRAIVEAYRNVGARTVTLCDTTGMATPPVVRNVVRTLRQDYPDLEFCLHLHNTRGLGLVNVMVGLDEGIRRFDASTGGLGGCPFAAGATGNVCTEDLVHLLEESGWRTGIDLGLSIEVAKKMEHFLGRNLPGQVMRAGPRLTQHRSEDTCVAAG